MGPDYVYPSGYKAEGIAICNFSLCSQTNREHIVELFYFDVTAEGNYAPRTPTRRRSCVNNPSESVLLLKTLRRAAGPEQNDLSADKSRVFKSNTVSVNPVRYPRFRVSAFVVRQRTAFAFGVPHDINGFYPYAMSSVRLSHPLRCAVSPAVPRLSPGF